MLKQFLILVSGFALLSCNQRNPVSTGIPVEHITATPDQAARRAQSELYCKTHKVPLYSNTNALFVNQEDSVTIRTKDEVVDRALALNYIGLKGDGLEQNILDRIDHDYHILAKLSPNEKIFAAATQPTTQQKTDATWRYEDLHVMLWALGFIDSLNYPNNMCDVHIDTKIINDLTETQFRQKAKLRSKKEILDQADLMLRLDWACVDARVKKQQAPGKLNSSVVYEWHYALNWLINFANENWDDVSTDT